MFLTKINSSTALSTGPEKIKNVYNSHVTLPKLTIENVDGKYESWQEFWEQFEVTVHKNVQLSNIEKLNYINNFFKGLTLKGIQGLALTQNNYDVAIRLLKDRFVKNKIEVRSHINKTL